MRPAILTHWQLMVSLNRNGSGKAKGIRMTKASCVRSSLVVAFVTMYMGTLLLLTGCASTKVLSHERLVAAPLPQPNHIWVYDFAATPSDVPPNSGFAEPRFRPAQLQTPNDVAAGRTAGAELAAKLVDELREMNLPAEQASGNTQPQLNDLILRGYVVSLDKGSTAKRFVIGFGSGAAQLTTAVEGYQVSPQGLRKLSVDLVRSSGNKTPGEALGVVGLIASANPAGLIVGSSVKAAGEAGGSSRIEGRARATAKEIAYQVKTEFQEQGWLN